METQIATIVGVLLTAGILWLVKTANDTRGDFRVFRAEMLAILKGPNGDNGILGTTRANAGVIAEMERRVDELANEVRHLSGGRRGRIDGTV